MNNILIVDDNYEFSIFLFNTLKSLYKFQIIHIANNGEEALNYIIENKVDLLLLDLNLPKLSGLELLKKLKEYEKFPKTIIISGENDYIIELIKQNIEVDSYFIKPFSTDVLVNKINTLAKDFEKNYTSLNITIFSILNKFCFNKSSIGYSYIVDCISICVEENLTCLPPNNLLYSKVAQKYNISAINSIGWNITKCIQSMLRLTDTDIIRKYFKYNPKPSTRAFLSQILNEFYGARL